MNWRSQVLARLISFALAIADEIRRQTRRPLRNHSHIRILNRIPSFIDYAHIRARYSIWPDHAMSHEWNIRGVWLSRARDIRLIDQSGEVTSIEARQSIGAGDAIAGATIT